MTQSIDTQKGSKVKLKCTLLQALVQVVRPIWGVELYLYSFLTTALEGGGGVSVTPQPLFFPGKDPVPIVQEVGWAPEPVWIGEEYLASTGIRSPDRSARSKSLYRPHYPALRKGNVKITHLLCFDSLRLLPNFPLLYTLQI